MRKIIASSFTRRLIGGFMLGTAGMMAFAAAASEQQSSAPTEVAQSIS